MFSRLAAEVTQKGERTKTRLIHDLRRSKINVMAKIPERIVLPRLVDAARSAVDIQKQAVNREKNRNAHC